jgi:hypothetical protein
MLIVELSMYIEMNSVLPDHLVFKTEKHLQPKY